MELSDPAGLFTAYGVSRGVSRVLLYALHSPTEYYMTLLTDG